MATTPYDSEPTFPPPFRIASRSTGTTFQVFIAAYEDYQRWCDANPGAKDPYKEYPSVSLTVIRNTIRVSGLHHLDEKGLMAQLRWLTQRKIMVSRKSDEQPGFSGFVPSKEKGVPLYYKLTQAELAPGCSVRDLLLDPASSPYWETLVVYAYLDNPRRDDDISDATGLSFNAIETARKKIEQGFTVVHPKTKEPLMLKAELRAKTVSPTDRTRKWFRVPTSPVLTESTPPDASVQAPISELAIGTELAPETEALVATPPVQEVCMSTTAVSISGLLPQPLQEQLKTVSLLLGVSSEDLIVKILSSQLKPLEEKLQLLQAKKEEVAKAEAEFKALANTVVL